jgi:hypothetical protein
MNARTTNVPYTQTGPLGIDVNALRKERRR